MRYLFLFGLILVSVLAALTDAANSKPQQSNQLNANHRNKLPKPANAALQNHNRSKPTAAKHRLVAKSHRNVVKKQTSSKKKLKGVLVDRNGKKRRAVVKSKPRRKAVRAVRKITRRVNRKVKPSARSRSINRRRSNQRKRFAKQEEADIENSDQEGFGEEQSVDSSGSSDAGTSPTAESGEKGTADQPASTPEETQPAESQPAQPDSTNQSAASPSIPSNLPSNFNLSKFNQAANGKKAVGIGYASNSNGPAVAFGYATSINGQNSAGGFGASFSTPDLLNSAQPDSGKSTQKEDGSNELAQYRRPRSILPCTPQTKKLSTGQISWIVCNDELINNVSTNLPINNLSLKINRNSTITPIPNFKSRILNKPPTLTQTHLLQSSPKRNTRKKYISNLRLYNTNNNNQTIRSAIINKSSRSSLFLNNRTPNSWTFTMISHNNNFNLINNTRKYLPSMFSGGRPMNQNYTPTTKISTINSFSNQIGNQSKNNTISLLSLPPQSSTQSDKSHQRSFKKLRNTNKRPFLSRSINFKTVNSNNTLNLDSNQPNNKSLESDLLVNNKLFTTTNLRSPNTRTKTTIVAISTSNHHQPVNFNPIQFMQNIFDQFFGSKSQQNGNVFFPWII